MSRQELFRRMRKSIFFLVGFAIIAIIVLLAIFAKYVTPFEPDAVDLTKRLTPPDFFSKGSSGYILGTDAVGQDILTRLLYGARISFSIAACVVLISSVMGTLLGLIAGYFGGTTDMIIMRLAEVQLSLPSMMLAIAVMAVLGASATNLLIVMSITSWVGYARMARSNVMSLRETEFVKASHVLGASHMHIIIKQLLPNVLTPLIIQASQQIGMVITMEASLSFLGCGVPPTTPTWGQMISDGRTYITFAPWTVLAPGLALMVTVLAFNFLGDGIRDVLDPKNNT